MQKQERNELSQQLQYDDKQLQRRGSISSQGSYAGSNSSYQSRGRKQLSQSLLRVNQQKSVIQGDLTQIQTIWSSASQMHQMTLSQLTCYQLQTNSYTFKQKQIPQFSEYIDQLLQPYQILIDLKQMVIIPQFSLNQTPCRNNLEFDLSFTTQVGDFEIYGCILYHLITNSIKHSQNKTKITLSVDFEFLQNQEFSGLLTTKVEDQGSGFDPKTLENQYQMFSYNRINRKQNEQSGVGIGLSTLKSLVEALAGTVTIKSATNDSSIATGSQVCFSIKTVSRIDSTAYNEYYKKTKELDFMQSDKIINELKSASNFRLIDRFLNKNTQNIVPQILNLQHEQKQIRYNSLSSASISSNDFEEGNQTPKLPVLKEKVSRISQKLRHEKSRVYFEPNQAEKNLVEMLNARKSLQNYQISENLLIRSQDNKKKQKIDAQFSAPQRHATNNAVCINSRIVRKSKMCTEICDTQVLLIDDSAFNSSCLDAILYECFKLKSISFESGQEAISCYQRRLSQKCCESRFQLVITDIQMPGLDGFQVANLIKTIDKNCNKNGECPILAATAFMSDEVYQNALKAGIKHVMPKPVKREDLFKIIKKNYFNSL